MVEHGSPKQERTWVTYYRQERVGLLVMVDRTVHRNLYSVTVGVESQVNTRGVQKTNS